MKRLLWVFWFVGLVVGKLSHAHIKATDLSGCEPAVASYEPADISLAAFVSHLATANIDSNREFTKFIKEFPDILQDKPLRRYPELQEQWDILWDRVRKKQLENLSELLTHLKQPEPSDEDSRINGHENQEFFADEAPVDAGNWIENKINEQDKHFNELSQEERDWRKNGKIGEYWQAIDEDSDAADYDSPEWKKDTIVALLNLNPKMTIQKLADRSGMDLSHAISLLKELQREERIGWIDDNHKGAWVVLNEENYARWARAKISVLLTEHPHITIQELADKTGIPHPKISEIARELTKAKVLDLLIKNPKMTIQDLADTINITVSQIKKTIKELQDKDQLVRIGRSKGGYWLVFNEKGEPVSNDPYKKIREAVWTLLADNPYLTIEKLAIEMGIPFGVIISRATTKLQQEGRLKYIGIGTGGYWLALNETGEPVNDPQKKIRETVWTLLTRNPYRTRQELANIIEIPLSQVRKAIEELIGKKRLEHIGSDKGGYWQTFNEKGEPISHDPHKKRKENIFILLKQDPEMTTQELADTTDSLKLEVIKALVELIDEGRLSYLTNGSLRYWQTVEKGEQLPANHTLHKWIKEEISALLIEEPHLTKQELADKTGILYSKISRAVIEIKKERILTLLKGNSNITIRELVEETGIPSSSVFRMIEELKKEGQVQHIGETYGGYWLILNDGDEPSDYDPQKEKEQTILILARKNLTRSAMAEIMGIPESQVISTIRKLIKKGHLKRVGSDRSGHWQVLQEQTLSVH